MEITLDSVTKRYGKVRALDDISLTFVPGEIVALLGVNGAGKTTLLRCLSSIVAQTSGHIIFDSQAFNRGQIELRRRLAFLPDFPAALPQNTMLQHIGMVLRLYGLDPSEHEPRLLQLLSDFDLLPYIEKALGQLSRGQLYKAALCALLAVDRELLLLDEPFASGMDPNGIASLKRELRASAARGNIILYSTQILEIAETFSDRVCILDAGKLRYYAPLKELSVQAADGAGGILERLFQQLREDRKA